MTNKLEFRHIPVGDQSIYTAVCGSGPLVLMVHGFPESWSTWERQLPAIASAGYTAAAIDVRGYGQSSRPEAMEDYSMAKIAADVAGVIDALAPEGAILVGHDWGAAIVYNTAVLYPEKVSALVGVSVPITKYADRKPSQFLGQIYKDGFFYQRYYMEPGVAEAEFDADPYLFMRAFYEAMSAKAPAAGNLLWGAEPKSSMTEGFAPLDPPLPWLDEDRLCAQAESLARGGSHGAFHRYRAGDIDVDDMRPHGGDQILQPALFIGGDKDPSRFMIGGVDRYADPVPRLADSRGVHILPDVGHWVTLEAPEKLNELILAFLRSLKEV